MSPRPTTRLRNIAAKIREQQPDIVLLQEVWAHAYARVLERGLAGRYRLTTGSGCLRPWPCGGLAVLVRVASGWTASSPVFVAYDASAPWYRLAEWDGIAKKGMLMVQLAHAGQSVVVVDTHLQTAYRRYHRDYTDIRRQQLEQLAATLDATSRSRPVLIGGDFNTAPSDRKALYASHMARLGDDRTMELRAACGECGTRPSFMRPARWLDYVLTRGVTASATAALITNAAIDEPFSDHDGVLVRLDYEPPALR